MKYIVCKIHNNSLGSVRAFDNENEAKEVLRGMAEEQFNRDLTDSEIDDLDNSLEIVNDEDSDNIFTYSIACLN